MRAHKIPLPGRFLPFQTGEDQSVSVVAVAGTPLVMVNGKLGTGTRARIALLRC